MERAIIFTLFSDVKKKMSVNVRRAFVYTIMQFVLTCHFNDTNNCNSSMRKPTG